MSTASDSKAVTRNAGTDVHSWHRNLARRLLPLRALLGLSLVAFGLATASAQSNYPNKPIRLVVPFPGGESIDAVARVVAERWSAHLGQPIIIENKPGAGGLIGTEFVSRAEPDGYTLLMGNVGGLAIIPSLKKKLNYDVQKDFAPISQVANVPFYMFVSSKLPMKTAKEVVDYAKKNPGKLNFASTGIGSGVHLAGELFKHLEKVDIVHVPYKGVGQALPALVEGNVHLVFYPITFLPQVKDGKLRPLAITASQRSKVLPDVPTSAEAGMPDMLASSWHAIVAPAGTPPALIKKLHETLAAAIAEPAIQARMNQLGADPVGSSPEELSRFLAAELAKWKTAVEVSGFTLD